ncbi:MAG: type I restriction endonuclease [Gemmatimonadales bacterium]
MTPAPEALARATIDRQLADAGWAVQDPGAVNLHAARGVAVREFPLRQGHGFADYLLYVDRKAVGVVEAKREGATLTGVEGQATKYSTGLPQHVPAPIRPLPFLYQTTGTETRFTSLLDPEPRSRGVFHFHRPETLAEWLCAEPMWVPAGDRLANRPASLRLRLKNMPEIGPSGLWPARPDPSTGGAGGDRG